MKSDPFDAVLKYWAGNLIRHLEADNKELFKNEIFGAVSETFDPKTELNPCL